MDKKYIRDLVKNIFYNVIAKLREDKLVKKMSTLRINKRMVERPPYEQLMKELSVSNYTQVGKKYDVSDNAIRKWIKTYKKYE